MKPKFPRRPRRRSRLSSIEVLEGRLLFCATHAAALVVDFFNDSPAGSAAPVGGTPAATTGIQSQPPGPTTGPTPGGFPSFTTQANGIPILNSLPSAPTAIYLDFDGSSVVADPVTPYSEDADGTTFNTAEQRTIFEAWREISSYFAIFDVNVTTVQPATSMPKAWLAVGNNISGGYSYVGVFPNSEPESWNQASDARGRVSGLAHELGHNFGLSHQATWDNWGVKTAEYASQTDALHGPIMGVDYSGTIHKFIWGHNSGGSGATTLQDDIAVIANRIKPYQAAGGDGMRADDFGNTIAAATALPVSGPAQWSSGIIERLADADAFSFTATGGAYALSAAPDAPSGVDLKLSVYRSDGTLIAEADGANNVQQVTLSLTAGTYYAIVSGHQNYGDVGRYFMAVSPLPAGWTSGEIGTGISGYSVHDAATGTFSLVGTGAGNTGSSDGMQFAAQTLTGNGTIIARVTNVDGTNTNAFAGITIRETNAVNAREVSVVRTFSNGIRSQYRTSAGGSTSSVGLTSGAFSPVWLRIVRTSNSFVVSTSDDGVAWTAASPITASMASTVSIGLIAGSANNHAMNVAQFDNVSVTGTLGAVAPVYNSLASPATPAVSLATGSGLTLTWSAVTGATGYAVERSSDGVTFAQAGTPANTSYTDASLTGSMRYFYRVSAVDGSGKSVPSAVASGVNRPSAVTNFSVASINTTTLVLNWRETTGETGYRIERSTDGVNFTSIATVAANQPSYTNSGLTSNVSYTYRVVPTSALGDGVATGNVTHAPRLAAVTTTLGTVAPGSITINWTDIALETGYRVERSTDGTTFTSLATLAAGVATYTDTSVAPATEYYYRVFGTTTVTQSVIGTVKFAAAPSATPPAIPWASQDIGTFAGPGTTDLTGSIYKLISSGTTIGGTSDSFRFTSRSLIDSGEIRARVDAIENTSSSAKVGLMIRSSTAANAANVFVYVTPTQIGFSSRSTAGGSTTTATAVTGSAPRWLRIMRAGNTFTGSYSSDGVTWTTIGTASVTMNSSVLAGLAGTSASSTVLNTSTLSNVAVSSEDVLAVTSINRANATPTNATSLQFAVNFSGSVTGVDATDFALALGGSATGTINAVTGSEASYTVTVTGISGSGSLGLNLVDNDSIQDLSGDRLGGTGINNGNFTGQVYTVDTGAPTVTINQAITQADPTSSSTVNFTVVFSEAVTDFTPTDVQLSGTAGATTASVVGQGTTFNVAVSGMIGPGTVIATLPAGAVRDGLGNLSAASTSTDNSVAFDNVPPTILKWESAGVHARGVGEAALLIPDDGSFSEPRLSGISTLLITFDSAIDPATLTPSSVGVWGNDASSLPINLTGVGVSVSTRSGDTVAVVTFSQALPNFARYLVRLTGVRDHAGNGIAGDSDRMITALTGDLTGDRRNNSTDVGAVVSLRGIDPIDASVADQVRADITNDGRINSTDVGGAVSARGNDARTIADPVATGGAGGSGSALSTSLGAKPATQKEFTPILVVAQRPIGNNSLWLSRFADLSKAAQIVNLL